MPAQKSEKPGPVPVDWTTGAGTWLFWLWNCSATARVKG